MTRLFNIASQVVRSFVVYSDQYLVASGLSEDKRDKADNGTRMLHLKGRTERAALLQEGGFHQVAHTAGALQGHQAVRLQLPPGHSTGLRKGVLGVAEQHQTVLKQLAMHQVVFVGLDGRQREVDRRRLAVRARGVAHVKQLKAKALREYELVLTFF